MSDIKENIIVELDPREWVLKRPGMFIGATKETSVEILMMDGDGKFEYETITYVPAFLKIIDEILSNSIDEAIRTNFKHANKISIEVTNTYIKVTDNGRGVPQIPSSKDPNKPMAVAAFTTVAAGTNFMDETKAKGSIGMNGVGSTATNIYSSKFVVKTSNGVDLLVLECTENMKNVKWNTTKKSQKSGTEVYFEPDLKRFGMSQIDEIYGRLIEQQVFCDAQIFPIQFTFENKISQTNVSTLF